MSMPDAAAMRSVIRANRTDERSWYGLVGSQTIRAVSVLASQNS